MKKQEVERLDRLFYQAEVPANWVQIVGMLQVEGSISFGEVAGVIEERLLAYPRFSQRIVHKDKSIFWEDISTLALEQHIYEVSLPNKNEEAEVRKYIGQIMSTPLPKDRPLWDVHLLQCKNGNSRLVWRIHHAIADGIALIHVLLSLTAADAPSSLSPLGKKEQPSAAEKPHRLKSLLHLGKRIYKDARFLALNPDVLVHRFFNAWDSMADLATFVSRSFPEDHFYKGRPGGKKKVAWSKPVSLATIKQYAHACNGKVNDALLALMAGSVRHHLLHHNQPTDLLFSVVAPVNMRGQNEAIQLENKIGFITLDLPIDIEDMEERMEAIETVTERLKDSPEPVLLYNTLGIVSHILNPEQEQRVAQALGKKITAVISNVPGPSEQVYIMGKPVKEMLFWIPQTNALGVGMGFISYNGQVQLGVSTDVSIIDDPEVLIEGFEKEYAKLEAELT